MTSKFSLSRKSVFLFSGLTALIAFAAATALGAQDRFTLKSPNGISFSEFRGYETWQIVAPSEVVDGIKSIQANDKMMAAYRAGVPGNGHAFPDGSAIVKIEWARQKNTVSPYDVTIPAKLMSVSFIEKDSKRFPKSNGWGYAQFLYDPATDSFKPYGTDASFNEKVCHACHIRVKAQDYIFTAYPPR